MARISLALSHVTVNGLADPAGVAGNTDGHKFVNDGLVLLRFVNARANANAVWTLSTDNTLTGGTLVLSFDMGLNGNAPKRYTTGALNWSITPANAALSVLAASAPDGNSLSTDYPSGTVTGAGTALDAGGPFTLTFGGTFAAWPIPAPSIDTHLLVGGDANAQLTTPGTGHGLVRIAVPHPFQGFPVGPKYLACPGGGGATWFGPFPGNIYNQFTGADTGQSYIDYDTASDYTVTALHAG